MVELRAVRRENTQTQGRSVTCSNEPPCSSLRPTRPGEHQPRTAHARPSPDERSADGIRNSSGPCLRRRRAGRRALRPSGRRGWIGRRSLIGPWIRGRLEESAHAATLLAPLSFRRRSGGVAPAPACVLGSIEAEAVDCPRTASSGSSSRVFVRAVGGRARGARRSCGAGRTRMSIAATRTALTPTCRSRRQRRAPARRHLRSMRSTARLMGCALGFPWERTRGRLSASRPRIGRSAPSPGSRPRAVTSAARRYVRGHPRADRRSSRSVARSPAQRFAMP
jgi:hypothetical protein